MRRFYILIASLLISLYNYGQGLSANFTATPLSGCSPLIVTFQDLSTGSPVAWSWDFGNGNTSALQNPSTTYFLPGTYTVRLTVTNAGGNTNTLVRNQYITVYDVPNVNFSVSSQTGCFPFRVQFTDLSTPGAGNTNVSWQWDFGNGATSTQQNPFVTYSTTGNYTVTLRVTNDKGCTKIISRPNYISVTPGVVAGFTNSQPTVCSAPADITFTNTSTGPGTLSYLWDFGDGTTSTLQNPVHSYTNNSTFNVTLTTISSSGCEDTATRTVTIGGFSTSFTGPSTACVNEPVAFANTASPVPVSVLWKFGDGNTSTQRNPTHRYAAPGTYTVWLYNTYNNCTDSISKTITINPLPVAGFTSPDTIKCEPTLLTHFQDLSTDAVSWHWDFGDGNTSGLQNPSHSYTSFGYYTVTLIVTNASGCTDTIQKSDFVKIAKPVVSIPSLPARGCIPYTHSFTPVINTLDNVTSYLWDFGDGSPASTSPNPTHTYITQGTYTVKLFITTSTGCTDSAVIVNGVRVGSKPIANFSATPIPVCAYKPVQFTDLSSTVDEWRWDFGDGTVSNLQNPTHIYTDTGYFTVRLIAANNGCPDTLIRTNYIQVLPPIARFAAVANCNNRLEFSFTDQSIGAVTWLWDFGDGTTSSLQNPVHTFPALGTYTVRLTVTNGSCTHSTTRTVRTIQQAPDFTADATIVCRRDSITFTPSNITPSLTSSLLWRFGNGVIITGTAAPIRFAYPASGNYTVTLVARDINGCLDSIVKNNYIRVNGPVANFNATNTAGCTGLVTSFNDLSTTDGINAITSWRFDFGDGNVQTFTSPPFQHTYNIAGTFNVKLVVTDASGCTDSLTRVNLITTTRPVPNFTSANTSSCPGAIVRFTNTSVATTFTSFWDFGDGNTSTATSPTHAYADTGSYTVKLIITDLYGCVDSIVRNNYIRISRPVASFIVNDSISSCTPFEVTFTNTSTYFSSALWSFGDGATTTLSNPTHYYSVPGVYRVRLLITSPGGCLDSAFINITLNDTAGSNITYTPLGGCNPLTVNLNTFTPGIISSYFWDFGDGTTLDTTASSVSHTYNSFGNFVPKVIMMDPSGCLIPITGLDTIRVIGSVPGFGFSDSLFCDSGYVTFSDSTTSSDPIASWQWNFGDGNTSSLQNPVHLYNTPGLFDVTLTITTQSGCVNSVTMPAAIKVVSSPLIDITGNTKICAGDSILHAGVFLRTDTSAVTWSWIFPNGNTSTLQNPPYQVYNTAGNDLIVTAIATNSSGCKDTATKNIIVNPLPTVTMPGLITVQAGFPVTIPATYSAGVNNWIWTPSTGLSCINCPTPDADPNFNTTYRVTFTDDNNCSNSDTIQVVVICKDGNLFMPNTFSPNGDGNNDIFYPRGRGLFSVKLLRIFNRWGEIVFEKRGFQVNDETQGWNGKYKGNPASPDVYVYQVEVVCDNGDIIKLDGNIALIL